jgi:hypothetical protein
MGRVELFVSWHEWARAEGELRQLVPAQTAAVVGEAVRFATYFAQTVTYIVPLANMDDTGPWFARWYAAWQRDFADLA